MNTTPAISSSIKDTGKANIITVTAVNTTGNGNKTNAMAKAN